LKSQQLYDLVDFLLYNKETIKSDLLNDVNKFLKHEIMFKGIYLIAFNQAYKEFITSLVRSKLHEHFPLLLETIAVIIDTHFLEEILGEAFYDKADWRNNGHTNSLPKDP